MARLEDFAEFEDGASNRSLAHHIICNAIDLTWEYEYRLSRLIEAVRANERERIAKAIEVAGAAEQTCNPGTATRWTDAAEMVRNLGRK